MRNAHAPTACECGCGITVKEGKRFVRGHWNRSPEGRESYLRRRKRLVVDPNPNGLCMCGCGETTPLGTDNHPERGYYAGQHTRYIPGHQIKKGSESHRWKGGRVVTPSGYVYLFLPDHPHANAKGYIYEHRIVMEKRMGRFLDPGERVHHLNHHRGDNRDENLILFPSHSEHVRTEHSQALVEWHKNNPEQSAILRSQSGKAGAEARWRGKK